MTLLRARHLHKSFGGVAAVVDVSFALQAGEIVALIGPNGAGKSTCFNLLNGQLRPDAGQVMLDGRDVTGFAPRRMAHLGVGRTFQIAARFASMTVRENVQTALLARRRQSWRFFQPAARLHAEAADDLLAQAGLLDTAGKPAGALAYGDVKRLELAIALAAEPRLLLMDEPVAGLPPSERRGLMALLRRMVGERGCAVLFTEHDMDVVFGIAERIMVMDRGELIASGDAASIRADPRVQRVYLGGEAE
jgi:branched-chain amino acid transport system ATP-binding protein